MRPEEGGAAALGELRSWWEVPAIAHFCSLFRTAFRLPDFEIEELEAALHRDDVEFISDLIACLLQGCYQRRDITFHGSELKSTAHTTCVRRGHVNLSPHMGAS